MYKSLSLILLFSFSTLKSEELKVLSWNIYSLPSIIGKKSVRKRAPFIAQALKSTKYDVLLLQEAFDSKTIKILKEYLAPDYPYFSKKPPRKGGAFWKISSGLMLFSRFPIVKMDFFPYKSCHFLSADCFSNKGLQYARINKNGKLIDIFNTHLQATSKAFKVKKKQMKKVEKIILNLNDPKIPQILGGDFNLNWYRADHREVLMNRLKPEFFLPQGYPHSTDSYLNTLRNYNQHERKRVDHIFLRKNKSKFETIYYRVARYLGRFRKDKVDDLSDHFMMKAIFKY